MELNSSSSVLAINWEMALRGIHCAFPSDNVSGEASVFSLCSSFVWCDLKAVVRRPCSLPPAWALGAAFSRSAKKQKLFSEALSSSNLKKKNLYEICFYLWRSEGKEEKASPPILQWRGKSFQHYAKGEVESEKALFLCHQKGSGRLTSFSHSMVPTQGPSLACFKYLLLHNQGGQNVKIQESHSFLLGKLSKKEKLLTPLMLELNGMGGSNFWTNCHPWCIEIDIHVHLRAIFKNSIYCGHSVLVRKVT